MANRFYIDAPGGVVEIEGERDYIESLVTRLFPLLEDAGFGSRPLRTPATQNNSENETVETDDAISRQTEKPEAKKRRVIIPPKGQSCASRITTLKDQGFFDDHRSVPNIVDGLKSKGGPIRKIKSVPL